MTKKLFSLAAAFLLAASASAQTTSGTVIYQEVLHIERPEGLSGPELEMLDKFLPKEMKNEKILRFTPSASLYTTNKKADDGAAYQDRSENGMNVRINILGNGDEQFFTDLQSGKQIQQTEFAGRKFLVTTNRTAGWKMTGRQKNILGHPCQEAALQKDTTKTLAWFATDMPVPAGPSSWAGLPGVVLEVSAENGVMTLTAVSVKAGGVAASDIVAPSKGKKVTQDEFRKVVDNYRKEMGATRSGNMIRVVREN
jgi:GLPGLI family protein